MPAYCFFCEERTTWMLFSIRTFLLSLNKTFSVSIVSILSLAGLAVKIFMPGVYKNRPGCIKPGLFDIFKVTLTSSISRHCLLLMLEIPASTPFFFQRNKVMHNSNSRPVAYL